MVPAFIEFQKELKIDLGGITVTLLHISGPHSRDSIVLYVPSEKVLFLGDSHGKDLYTLRSYGERGICGKTPGPGFLHRYSRPLLLYEKRRTLFSFEMRLEFLLLCKVIMVI